MLQVISLHICCLALLPVISELQWGELCLWKRYEMFGGSKPTLSLVSDCGYIPLQKVRKFNSLFMAFHFDPVVRK